MPRTGLLHADRQGAGCRHTPGGPLVRARRRPGMRQGPLGARPHIHRRGVRPRGSGGRDGPHDAFRGDRQRRRPDGIGEPVSRGRQGPLRSGRGLRMVPEGRRAGRVPGEVQRRLHVRPRDRGQPFGHGGRGVVRVGRIDRPRGHVHGHRPQLRVRSERDKPQRGGGRQVVQVRRGHGPREVHPVLEFRHAEPRRGEEGTDSRQDAEAAIHGFPARAG